MSRRDGYRVRVYVEHGISFLSENTYSRDEANEIAERIARGLEPDAWVEVQMILPEREIPGGRS